MKEERLDGALQENVLVLLVFDENASKLIRGSVSPQLFESALFREIAGLAIDFIDQYQAPIGDHLPDHLEHVLNGSDKRKAASYKRLLDNLYLSRDSVNAEYVVSQLHKFVRQQQIKAAIVRAVEKVESGEIDAAEVELQKGLSAQVSVFERGTVIKEPDSALAFMEDEEPPLLTGIHELDIRGIGPARKEQFVVMAPPNFGKTWALIHLGKWALLQRQTVVHITLEMSERKVAQRYLQSFFAISKRDGILRLPVLEKDKRGGLSEVLYEEVEHLTFNDPNIRAKLTSRIKREFRRRPNLVIKEFPMGALTIQMLDAYLDGLERFHKIYADVVIIDYPELMHLDSTDLRISIGANSRLLRGQAQRRNYAQIIAAQSNREGAKARTVDTTHTGEDFSKVATADNIITYSRTSMERKMNLARLLAAKVRNEEAGFVTMITQSYATGQFALDSAYIGEMDYFDYISGKGHGGADDD